MFFKYPSIDQLKQVKYDLQKIVGVGNLPKLSLTGTVKIHGTNGGVTITRDEDLFVQSRNRVLTKDSDNAGFCNFVEGNYDYFESTRQKLCNQYSELDIFTIYGEWCGGNVQKGVGVTGMEPTFIIFSVRGRENEEGDPIYIPLDAILSSPENNIFKITDFKQFSYDLDLSCEDSIKGLQDITLSVEEECPVAKALNPEGNLVGEGLVWTTNYNGKHFKFKHKGEKHARGGGSRKVKASESYSEQQIEAINRFCEKALSEDRLLQGVEYLQEMELDASAKNTGSYLKWVNQDICKEMKIEIDELEEIHGILWKKLSKKITNSAREFYNQL